MANNETDNWKLATQQMKNRMETKRRLIDTSKNQPVSIQYASNNGQSANDVLRSAYPNAKAGAAVMRDGKRYVFDGTTWYEQTPVGY